MAYSSDTPSEQRRGFVPPQNDDERLLMRRVEEFCHTAESRGIPRYTGFLSDREQTLAWAACRRAGCGCAEFRGGYPDAERRVLCIEPPDTWREEPLAFLTLRAMPAGERLPAHRDYLGAILGLGLDRACLGDLLQDPQEQALFYAAVLADKAAFIAAELTGAGACPVQVAVCEALLPQVLARPQPDLREATVSSLRADAVLAAMMRTSRAKAAEYIAAGRVEINHLPLKAPHGQAYAGDVFTVRGTGRYRLVQIGGKSRKERLFITYYQY